MHGRYGGDLGRATGSVGAGRRCLGGREQGPTLILHAGQELMGDAGQGASALPYSGDSTFSGPGDHWGGGAMRLWLLSVCPRGSRAQEGRCPPKGRSRGVPEMWNQLSGVQNGGQHHRGGPGGVESLKQRKVRIHCLKDLIGLSVNVQRFFF